MVLLHRLLLNIFKYFHLQLYKLKKKILNLLSTVLWESNIDNLYYGHYFILKEYCRIYLPYKINGEIQHGWNVRNGIGPNNYDLMALFDKNERYYLWNKWNLSKSQKDGLNNTIGIGAPFLYLLDMYSITTKPKPKSLILFPLHSCEHDNFIEIENVYSKYIKEINEIKSHFGTITVSLYHTEFRKDYIVNLFTKQNISTVCMGERDNNPKFLKNFIEIVKNFDYVSSESWSSAIFYSLAMKKRTFIYGNSMWYSNDEHNRGYQNIKKIEDKYRKKYPQILWENFDHRSHYKIANEELGLRYKKSSQELRSLFGWNLTSASKTIFKNVFKIK